MDQSQPARRCKYCRRVLPLDQFEMRPSGRRARRCDACREQDERETAEKARWDWAKAVRKAASMSARHAVRTPERLFSQSLTSEVIHDLMRLQNNRCVLTGETFLLPPEDYPLTVHKTLDKWLEKLRPKERENTPVLVRLNIDENWEPGNVMLICLLVKPLYERCGGLGRFRETIEEWNKRRNKPPRRHELAEEGQRKRRKRAIR